MQLSGMGMDPTVTAVKSSTLCTPCECFITILKLDLVKEKRFSVSEVTISIFFPHHDFSSQRKRRANGRGGI